MPEPVRLSRRRARQLAVMGQMLDAPRPRSILEVVRGLGMVQEDPTAVVARTEHLVLWSRLGRRFRIAELNRLLYAERSLFEYWVHIVPIEDLPIHRESMTHFGSDDYVRNADARAWLAANQGFRRSVLRELRVRGPLRSRDLADRAAVRWEKGGWSDDRPGHVGMLLDLLWHRGEIAIVGRDGNERLWDLAERRYPKIAPVSNHRIARELIDRQLRARGVDRLTGFGSRFDARHPGRDRALGELQRKGTVVPVEVEGVPGRFFAHGELLDRPFRGRTALLSPFDDLLSDRRRTEELFDFRYRLQIYVPKAKREHGYFALPILRGDRVAGRIDLAFDRTSRGLRVLGVWAEEHARPDDWAATRGVLDDLAAWLGAVEVAMPARAAMPAVWRSSAGRGG